MSWLTKIKVGLALSRANKQFEKETRMGSDPKVSLIKGAKAIGAFLLFAALTAIGLALADEKMLAGILAALNINAAYVGLVVLAARGASVALLNWVKNNRPGAAPPKVGDKINLTVDGDTVAQAKVTKIGLFLLAASLPSMASASLWQAGAEAGSRYPAQEVLVISVPLDRIADALVTDWVFNGLGTSADLISTDWSINEGCVEANPLGQRVEGRVALKVGAMVTRAVVSYWLRRSGHRVGANVWRWAGFAVDAGITMSNIRCGVRA